MHGHGSYFLYIHYAHINLAIQDANDIYREAGFLSNGILAKPLNSIANSYIFSQ